VNGRGISAAPVLLRHKRHIIRYSAAAFRALYVWLF